jgi:5-methylthioadenosine/S-adenosylhomocysteine deaminase
MNPAAGCSTLQLLHRCGALNPRTLLVHGVQLAAGDREIIRKSGAAWAHCPKSNAKLGNGIAPLGLMRDSYGPLPPRIGLGSDSVASNNTMDLFEEMRFAVLAQRARSRKIEALSAREAVEMATIGGARALGMEALVGSLTPGKQADLIAVRLDNLSGIPAHDPYSALVFAGSARDVQMTMIGGTELYERGRFTHLNLSSYRARLLGAGRRIRTWSLPRE